MVNSASVMAWRLLATALGFITRTVFIQTLGKSYLGINGLFANILSMLSLAELGFGQTIVFRLYKPLAEHDEKRIRVLLKAYRHIYRIIGVVILLLGLGLIPFLPTLIRDYSALAELGINAVLLYLLFLAESVASYLFFGYLGSVLSADQKEYITVAVSVVVSLAKSAVQIFFLLFYKNFIYYTLVSLVFTVVQNLLYAGATRIYYPWMFVKEPDRLSRDEYKELFKDCGSVFAYKLYNRVLTATDNIIISAWVGLSAVGLYSNYLLFFSTISSFIDSIQTVIRHSMGNLFATESVENNYRFFETLNFINVIFYGTASVGIAVCADELITAWIGAEYVIGHGFSAVVGIELLMKGLVCSLNQVRETTGIFQRMWYRPIISSVMNIGLSVWMVQFWGIHGVLLGTVATYLCIDFLFDPFIVHKYSFGGYKPAAEYYGKIGRYIALLAIIGCADRWLCCNVLTGLNWGSVLIHILITGISVPAVFVLAFWKTNECRYVVRHLGFMLKKWKH